MFILSLSHTRDATDCYDDREQVTAHVIVGRR